jgi:hypothetical protein
VLEVPRKPPAIADVRALVAAVAAGAAVAVAVAAGVVAVVAAEEGGANHAYIYETALR